MNDVVLVELRDGHAILTINRPEKLNAINMDVLELLERAVRALESNTSVRCIVVTGAGEKAFVAGADIAQLHEQDAHSGRLFAEFGQRVFNAIERSGKPYIAAVNGFALGGGCELAMACHMRFASENAKFGQPEINLGIIPGYGGTQRLPRLIGAPKALELILGGGMISAAEAKELRLVNAVYPQAELMTAVESLAQNLATKAPLALHACLEAVRLATDTALLEGLHAEASIFGRVCGSEDFKEGTQAFLEKRAAQFNGQ